MVIQLQHSIRFSSFFLLFFFRPKLSSTTSKIPPHFPFLHFHPIFIPFSPSHSLSPGSSHLTQEPRGFNNCFSYLSFVVIVGGALAFPNKPISKERLWKETKRKEERKGRKPKKQVDRKVQKKFDKEGVDAGCCGRVVLFGDVISRRTKKKHQHQPHKKPLEDLLFFFFFFLAKEKTLFAFFRNPLGV